MSDDLVKRHIRACIEAQLRYDRHIADTLSARRAAGYRIVTTEERRDGVTWFDYDTGEVIGHGEFCESGTVDPDVPESVWSMWYHHDAACDDAPLEDVVTPGLPEGLQSVLDEYVGSLNTYDEAFAWAGLVSV